MTTSISIAPWLKKICELPVGFAQVREDPLLDIHAIENLKRNNLNALIIASGGCTATALATHPAITQLTLVDANPAQLALTQLKLFLLEYHSPSDRMAILGHRSIHSSERRNWISSTLVKIGCSENILGNLDLAGHLGLDYIGRYEHLFAALQNTLCPFKNEIFTHLNTPTPFSCSHGFKMGLREAFSQVMALDHLVALYSYEATQNPAKPFWEHFFLKTVEAIESSSAYQNPFLAQLLLGQFCHHPYTWINYPQKKINCAINILHTPIDKVLEGPIEYDFIHLSNALDWLSEADAKSLLIRVEQRLAPGGTVILRQLNSILDISALSPDKLSWDIKEKLDLINLDRSFFYNRLYIGRKL